MNKEQTQMVGFNLIAHSGDALDHFFRAINYAEEGMFDEAEEEIKAGDAALVDAHKAQMDLLAAEAGNEEIELSLILIHSQDHLMTTLNYERFAQRFITLYRKLYEKSE